MSSQDRRPGGPGPVRVRLRKPLERSVAAGHPWVYRDALDPGFRAPPGREVVLLDRRGKFLARGVSDAGPIGLRVWTLEDEPVDRDLLARRVQSALSLRARALRAPGPHGQPFPAHTDALRLLHGEGDRTPGIVCDRYGPRAVVRFDGQGAAARYRAALRDLLPEALAPMGVDVVLERAGRGASKSVTAWHPSPAPGEPPAAPVSILEHGMVLLVDLVAGQKTGLFLDQRDSRRRVRDLAEGGSVLNLYGYTGGFSVAAALGGARRVDTVDVAKDALDLAARSFAANDLGDVPHATHAADVSAFLDVAKARDDHWDLVIADPPSFAPRASAVRAALTAYRELHRASVARVADGGLYLAASCSSHVDRGAFEDTLERGARAAGRVATVVDRWEAPPDHPRQLAFPEGNYLTVVLCRVTPR